MRAFFHHFLLPELLPQQSQFIQIGNSLELQEYISDSPSCALQKMDGWRSQRQEKGNVKLAVIDL